MKLYVWYGVVLCCSIPRSATVLLQSPRIVSLQHKTDVDFKSNREGSKRSCANSKEETLVGVIGRLDVEGVNG